MAYSFFETRLRGIMVVFSFIKTNAQSKMMNTANYHEISVGISHEGSWPLILSFVCTLQDYKEKFESRLVVIREAMNAQIQNEERWTRSWQRSINKIKELY